MTMSAFPSGFKDGISLRGVPITQSHPGKVFWVSNSTVQLPNQKAGSNSNDGSFNAPFSTIDYAIGQCLADRGDIIFVKPGHAETVTATSIAADVAGVAIIGLGTGTKRPTLTFSTAAATITVSAANVSFQNILFVANFANVATYFTLSTAKDFTLERNEFRDTSSILNALSVVTTGATNNAADGLWLAKNRISALGTTAATTAIIAAGNIDRFTALDNYLNYAAVNNTATLCAATSKVLTNVDVGRNIVFRPNTDTSTGGILITNTSTTDTGMVYDNYIKTLDVAGMLLINTGTKLGFTNNLISGTADTSGILIPAADSDGS